jgi:hypothetical protein
MRALYFVECSFANWFVDATPRFSTLADRFGVQANLSRSAEK